MRRFKASKYKNAAPKLKKHESWVRDVIIGSYNCSGSFIKASAAFVAFNVQATGCQLGIVPLDAEGVSGTTLPVLNAHSDLVTDFEFSPFEDGLLATGSADSTVKIWSFNNSVNDFSMLNPELVMSSKHRRVETVSFSPTAEYLLSFSAQNTIQFWDILYGKELLHDTELHGDTIMSMSWCRSGSLLATCAKDKQVRIVDPRANVVTSSAPGHDNGKDSRVVWLGDSNFILTSGFDSSRMRQLFVWDTRVFEKPLKTLSFGSSTGILMPLHDPDTNMIFLAGRGDSSIGYYEFSESDDFLIEGYRYNGDQTKGACLLPKRALKVMDTEVNRILQLTANSVVPIPFHVPRKSYVDFHQDLYPDTYGTNTTGSASVWMDGFTGTVGKISLNPSVNGSSLRVFKEPLAERKLKEEQKISKLHETPESDKYKKSIPEPRPRKKSISSGSSSSDEVGDNPPSGKFFPVPKPRVSSNAATSVLRTPSSFISSRMAADFTQRNSVPKEIEAGLQQSVATGSGDTTSVTEKRNGANDNDNENESYSNNNEHGPQSLAESNDNDEISSSKDPSSLNGNENDRICTDENISETTQQLSTLDRRKMFENRISITSDGGNDTNGGSDSFEDRKPRMSVAERMKMFQQNSAGGGGGNGEEENNSSQSNNSHNNATHHKITTMSSEDSSSGQDEQMDNGSGKDREPCPAPIAKPERKFTPPKQETPAVASPAARKQEKSAEPVSAPSKPATSNKRIDTVFGQVSKYRNYKAAPLHKKMHIENLRNISTTCPGESELIQANPDRVAVPLNTPGGKVAVFELSKPGRQPDGVIPALVHGSKVMDFMWDPFNNSRLAVGDDSGKLWLWTIPSGGLKEQTNEADFTMAAHAEKIYFVRFHPLAEDVLATGSYDMTIRIWNLDSRDEITLIRCFDQIQIFCFAWSPCGQYFATAAKDGKLRVYDPREQTDPIAIGQGPPGVRGGRASWVLDGKFLIVAGFDRSSERQLHMYDASDLSKVTSVSLDVSPAILVPFYDEDSSVLFLSGRGDSTIFAYDVIESSPYLLPLSPHRCSGAHQGISFLKKNACEVQNVEFAKAYRLTEVVIEPWSFTVPRVKSEYFQDDLFPPTKVLWEPTMTAESWTNGSNVCAKRISLKPTYMRSLCEMSGHRESSEANGVKATNGKGHHGPSVSVPISTTGQMASVMASNGAKKQQKELEQALKSKLPLNLQLEQDNMEGVDDEEWDE